VDVDIRLGFSIEKGKNALVGTAVAILSPGAAFALVVSQVELGGSQSRTADKEVIVIPGGSELVVPL
jgi:hypothetical protein